MTRSNIVIRFEYAKTYPVLYTESVFITIKHKWKGEGKMSFELKSVDAKDLEEIKNLEKVYDFEEKALRECYINANMTRLSKDSKLFFNFVNDHLNRLFYLDQKLKDLGED